MQQRWWMRFLALPPHFLDHFKEYFMGCCFCVRIVSDLVGNTLGLLIRTRWGWCCFNLLVYVHIKGGMPVQSQGWGGDPLVQKCHHLQVTCLKSGCSLEEEGKKNPQQNKAKPLPKKTKPNPNQKETPTKNPTSYGPYCSVCAEIYGSMADVFSSTKINRVIYGDWFRFWKLVSDGWSFLLFFPWKGNWAITCQWWNRLAKPAAFLCAKQRSSDPIRCENRCHRLLPVLFNA